MISGGPFSFRKEIYGDVMETSSGDGGGGLGSTQLGSFLCNLSLLKEKVHQVQSLAGLFFPVGTHIDEIADESASVALASMGTLIQEILATASSMMFNCQQMCLSSSPQGVNSNCHSVINMVSDKQDDVKQIFPTRGGKSNSLGFSDGGSFFNWYVDNTSYAYNKNDNVTWVNNNLIDNRTSIISGTTTTTSTSERKGNLTKVTNGDRKVVATTTSSSVQAYDIVELDAAALLAKYTHYCQICGKGFKRDANLRMHMRAHGDEYKSTAALSNPFKNKKSGESNHNEDHGTSSVKSVLRKYSCPHDGCKWNKNHAKFQPLKSMICVKNHYKRSHCPKMYVCKRCNTKQFSVLSDLRTHEKHCGDLKWQCSCGTTFSRKDKLMGHVSLFAGHTPLLISPLPNPTNNLLIHDHIQAFSN